jgi:hypothetical protein
MCFGLQPLADDTGAPLAICWPSLREAVVSDVVRFDAERLLDDLGCEIAVAAINRLFKKVSHVRLTQLVRYSPPSILNTISSAVETSLRSPDAVLGRPAKHATSGAAV